MAITTRREFSAGGVIYRTDINVTNIALISKNRGAVWCLPKGKIEPQETTEAAAEREIREETGLVGKLIKLLGDIAYQYISALDGARIFKKVRFFLFEYTGGIIGKDADPDCEVEEVKWFNVADALKILTYPSEKDIVKKAVKEMGA